MWTGSFHPFENRAGVGWSKVGHMAGTFVTMMMRQGRPSHFCLSSSWPRIIEKMCQISHQITYLILPLGCTVVKYNPQIVEVCKPPMPSTLPGSGLNYITTESCQGWKPDERVWGLWKVDKTGGTSGSDNSWMDDNIKVVKMKADPLDICLVYSVPS